MTQVNTISINSRIQELKQKINVAMKEALKNPSTETLKNLENVLEESKTFRKSLVRVS